MFALEDKAVRTVCRDRGNQLRVNVKVVRGQLKVVRRIGQQMGTRLHETMIVLDQKLIKEREEGG